MKNFTYGLCGLVLLLASCRRDALEGGSDSAKSRSSNEVSGKFAVREVGEGVFDEMVLKSHPDRLALRSILDADENERSISLLDFFRELLRKDSDFTVRLFLSELAAIAREASFDEVVAEVFKELSKGDLVGVYEIIKNESELSESSKEIGTRMYLIRLSQLDPKGAKDALLTADVILKGGRDGLDELFKNLKLSSASDYKPFFEAKSLQGHRETVLFILGEICADRGESPNEIFKAIDPEGADVDAVMKSWLGRQNRVRDSNDFLKVLNAMGSLSSEERKRFMSGVLPIYMEKISYSEADVILRENSLNADEVEAAISALSHSLGPRELVGLCAKIDMGVQRDAAFQAAFHNWVSVDSAAASGEAQKLTGRDRDSAFLVIGYRMRRSGDVAVADSYLNSIESQDLKAKAEELVRSIPR